MPKKTVLVVDDQTDVRLMLRLMLPEREYDIVEATTGTQAVELLGSRGADVVLLDIHLPDIEGWDVLRRIRLSPSLSHVPVIVVTADMTARDSEQARTLRHEGFLAKPFSWQELLSEIQKVLRPKVG